MEMPLVHEVWLASLKAAGRRPTTLSNYRYAVEGLSNWRGDNDLTAVSKFEALRYTAYLNETYMPGGVRNRLKALRNFYSWAVREEMAEANPFIGIVVRMQDETQPIAEEEAITKMLASAKRNLRDLALLTLMVDSGARKAEVAALTVADVDLTSGSLHIRVSKTRPRTIPLSDRSVVVLSRWLRRRGVAAGSLWSVGDPYSLVKQCVRRHSGGAITPHQLRRAFAVRWLLAGGSEVSLMRICGWSSRAMIVTYTRASADVVAEQEFRRLLG
jgi:integrase